MSDYTPTLEDAKRTYAYIQGGLDHDEGYKPFYQVHEEAFDRMIAEVKRAAAARALEEAADEIFVQHAEFDPGKRMAFHRGADAVYDALRARAAEIRGKETGE